MDLSQLTNLIPSITPDNIMIIFCILGYEQLTIPHCKRNLHRATILQQSTNYPLQTLNFFDEKRKKDTVINSSTTRQNSNGYYGKVS